MKYRNRLTRCGCLLLLMVLLLLEASCGNSYGNRADLSTASGSLQPDPVSSVPTAGSSDLPLATPPTEERIFMELTITAGDTVIDAVLFDNQTARAVAGMLPLTVPTWHPAPDFARAFDLPQGFPYFAGEAPGRTYELGSLAYWEPGPSIAMIYHASRTETVVPVVPIGKMIGDVSVFFEYSGEITIAPK